MSDERLVARANRIAAFFAAYPRERAVAGVRDHLEKFWAPSMRRRLADHAAQGGTGLHELVRAAADGLKAPAPR